MYALLLRPDGSIFAEDEKCAGALLACVWARKLVDAARETGTYRLILRASPMKLAPLFATTFRKGQAHA
jgi:hypothetical protein